MSDTASGPKGPISGLRRTTVRDVMTTDVVSAGPGASFAEIVAALRERAIRAMPVVDHAGRLLGVVSEADVLRRAEHGDPRHPLPRRSRPWWRRRAAEGPAGTARELMSTAPVTVGPDVAVAEAARTMSAHRVGWLPVVEDAAEAGSPPDPVGPRVVGVIGRVDLLRVFDRDDADLAREVRDEVLGRILLVDPHRVAVTVADGVVTLNGTVPTRADAVLAGTLTERLEGVVAVDNQLVYDVDERTADLSDVRRSDGAPISRM